MHLLAILFHHLVISVQNQQLQRQARGKYSCCVQRRNLELLMRCCGDKSWIKWNVREQQTERACRGESKSDNRKQFCLWQEGQRSGKMISCRRHDFRGVTKLIVYNANYGGKAQMRAKPCQKKDSTPRRRPDALGKYRLPEYRLATMRENKNTAPTMHHWRSTRK